jgi:gliding motility-associated-like protein
MKLLYNIFLIVLYTNIGAQVTYDWSKHIDQTSANASREVAVMGVERDVNDNVFIIGRLRGIADFDLASASGTLSSIIVSEGDPFIVKYDSLGNFLWGDVITNGTSTDGRAVSIALDNVGNAYVVGDVNNPGLSGKGFLAKYSPTGTRLFKIETGGYPGVESEVVTLDNAGGVYIGYKFGGTVDFDPGAGVVNRTAGGSSDNYLAKYNSTSGAFQWVKIFGTNITFRDIEYDNLTNTIYTFGAFSGTQDFNPDGGVNNLTVSSSSAFVAQYNPSTGAYVNAYAINNSSGTQGVWDMKIQGDDLYAVFLYNGTVDFQPGAGTNTLTAGSNSIAIAKYKKSTMQLSWVYPSPIQMGFGSPSIRIAMNGGDELMVYGEYTGIQDFDPGAGVSNLTAGAVGGSSFAAYSIDSSGSFVWAANIGENSGNFRLFYHDLIADGKGGFYVGGDFDDDVSLDPANNVITYNEGAAPNDGFLAHYVTCLSGVNTTATTAICETGTKALTSNVVGGSWNVVSGGGSILGTTYTPANVTVNTNVTVRFTDGCGNISDRVFTVNVNNVASNTTSTASICETGTKTLVGSPIGGNWSIVSGGGSISVTTYTPANVTANTSVTVRYTIPVNGACSVTTSDIIFTVNVSEIANNTMSTSYLCTGSSRALTGTPLGGIWSELGAGTLVPGSYIPPSLLPGGSVGVSTIYTIGANGACVSSADTVDFIVVRDSTVIATSSVADMCNGDTRGLVGVPTGGVWNVVSGPGSILGTTLTATGSGTVSIEYTVTSSCGNGSDTIDIVINPTPNISAGLDENICLGDSVMLTATGGGAYQWVPGPAVALQQIFPIITTGYRVDITSDSGCVASDSVTVFVQTSATAIAQNNQAIVVTGVQESIDIYTNDVGGVNTLRLLLMPNNGTASISGGNVVYISTVGYLGNDTIEYEICDGNCLSICDTAFLYIAVESDLKIPVGVSVNGDGKNDVFNILGLNRYPNNSLKIFNRWGSLIFQGEPYLNNWEGQSTKGEVVEGTYFYVLKLEDDLPTRNGYIELKK